MERLRQSKFPMMAVDDAVQVVLQHSTVLPGVTIPLHKSRGSVLLEEVLSTAPFPPFRASILDGYALDASTQGPGVYRVLPLVAAGDDPSKTHAISTPSPSSEILGDVVAITTGAPLPSFTNAVIGVEKTEYAGSDEGGVELVRILQPLKVGQAVRQIGSDMRASEIGLLAGIGVTEVNVVRRAKVGVLSTGNELVEPHETPKDGQIRDSNRLMLLNALRDLDLEVETVDYGIAPDDKDSIEALLHKALSEVDMLITTGGVSMGDLDFVKPILQTIGTVHFGRVMMKPGKPTTFATVSIQGREKLVFGLPGNPVSGLVTFHLFCVPALRALSGFSTPLNPSIKVKITHSMKLDPERPEYHRCITKWSAEQSCFFATSTGNQISSRLLSMRSANTLVLLPRAEGEASAGTTFDAMIIGPLEWEAS